MNLIKEEDILTAKIALWIHVHQIESWALVLRDHVSGEMKFRLNGGLGHFSKLCVDLEKNMGENDSYLLERGQVIDRLLSLSKTDIKRYEELIDLIQMYLEGEVKITDDGQNKRVG